jgi:hypothetical protein
MNWLDKYPSTNILFHHRFPTSTENIKRACHPFSTKDFFDTNYILVHNGVIRNDDELKAEHEAMGIKYSSEHPDGSYNDSEALLWDVALMLEGKQKGLKALGAIAFVCMAIKPGRKHDKLYFARNTNPLNLLYEDDIGFMLSSEGPGEPIVSDALYSYNYVTRVMKTTPLEMHTWTKLPAARQGVIQYSPPSGAPLGRDSWYRPENERWPEDDRWNANRFEAEEEEGEDALILADLDDIEKMLLTNKNTPGADINRTFDTYMWAADGHFASAWTALNRDLDDLYAYEELFKPGDERVNYTIAVFETTAIEIRDEPGYVDHSSVHETYNWSAEVVANA